MLLQGGACASTVAALQRLGVMLQVSHMLPFFHSVNAFTAFEGPAWTSRLKPAMQLRPRLSFTPLHVHYCHKNSYYVQHIALTVHLIVSSCHAGPRINPIRVKTAICIAMLLCLLSQRNAPALD